MKKIYTKAQFSDEVSQRELDNFNLSRNAAEEAIVLLENDGVLPLQNKTIALYGLGASMTIKGGTGSGEVNERHCVSILEGVINSGFNVTSIDWINEFKKLYLEKRNEYIKLKRKKLNILKINSIMSQLSDNFIAPVGRIITEEDVIKSNTDTCIYVLSRQAGEALDRKVEKGSYLVLDEELEFIKVCAENYQKFVLVINVGSSIDLCEIKKIEGINAIVYISQLGCAGGDALANILSGKVSPSGKLSNTWVKDYSDIPNGNNYGPYSLDKDNYNYSESIYVGYRYYDSFNVDVMYPFGYGLSYSNFKIQCKDIVVLKNKITLTINITNIGNFLGKEVVQIYLKKPSKKLKQPNKVLVDFVKSELLSVNESKDYTITFDIFDYASYYEDESSYILESGDYIISIGNSSNNTKDICVLELGEDFYLSKHQNICKQDNSFKELDIFCIHNGLNLKRFVLDFSKINKIEYSYDYKYQYQEEAKEIFCKLKTKDMINLVVGDGMFLNNPKFYLPGCVGNTTSKLWKKGLVNVAFCDGPAGIRLQKRSGVTKRGKIKAVDAALGLYELLPKFVKKIVNADPKKTKLIYQFTTSFPVANALAQTWNKELLYKVGCAINKEMEEYGCTYWLAPAINIQLNPLCGRNFEYFSEEPVLAGKLASSIIKGIQSKAGFYATVKHFACNNQETNRETVNAHISERTLREIYLKAFEICVKEGKVKGVMTSYNKINGVYSANNYDLCTKVLRCEWGFTGVVMTDWYSTRGDHADNALAIKAGNDLIMPGGFTMAKKEIRKALRKKKLTKLELFNASYNIALSILNSQTQKEYIKK